VVSAVHGRVLYVRNKFAFVKYIYIYVTYRLACNNGRRQRVCVCVGGQGMDRDVSGVV